MLRRFWLRAQDALPVADPSFGEFDESWVPSRFPKPQGAGGTTSPTGEETMQSERPDDLMMGTVVLTLLVTAASYFALTGMFG